MIPKIIHYCWFGKGKMPKSFEKNIKKWKNVMPDYEIIRWDESNYDIKKNKYMYDAYINKKWGFVPDYARLDIIYEYGGIYLDTDVEVIKKFDELLDNDLFCGIEENGKVNFGLGFGAKIGNSIVKELRDYYEKIDFINTDNTLNLIASPVYQTEILRKYGLKDMDVIQKLNNLTIYSKEYFNPVNMNTGIIELNEKTYSIHHYAGTWLSKKEKLRYEIHKLLNRTIGIEKTNWIKKNILHIK